MDRAYTSASTALNQNESVKANDKLPISAQLPTISASSVFLMIEIPKAFFTNNTIEEYKTKTVNALA